MPGVTKHFIDTYDLLDFIQELRRFDATIRQGVMKATTLDEAMKAIHQVTNGPADFFITGIRGSWYNKRDFYLDNVLEPLLKNDFQFGGKSGKSMYDWLQRKKEDKREQSVVLKKLQSVFANPITTAEKMRVGFVEKHKSIRKGYQWSPSDWSYNWLDSNLRWKRPDGWQPGGLKYAAAQARIGVGLQEYQWGSGAMLSISNKESLNQAFTNGVIRIQNISTNDKNAPVQLIKELEGLLALQNKKALDHDRYDAFMEAIVKDIGLVLNTTDNGKLKASLKPYTDPHVLDH